MKIEQYGFIKEGVLKIFNKKRFEAELHEFPDADVIITIKKKGRRTLPTNNYYWGCIVKSVRLEFGRRGIRMDDEQVHEFLKLHFNKQYVYGDGGEVIGEFGGSTAEMNQEEMSEYFERICQWCSEKLGLVIDPPNSQTSFNYAA